MPNIFMVQPFWRSSHEILNFTLGHYQLWFTCLDARHNGYNSAPCPLAFCILISHREEFVSPEQGNTRCSAQACYLYDLSDKGKQPVTFWKNSCLLLCLIFLAMSLFHIILLCFHYRTANYCLVWDIIFQHLAVLFTQADTLMVTLF